jgi:hypothetical protein
VAEELPGCIPRVLRLDDISLRRADETVFNSIDLNTEGGHVRLGMELLTVFTTATLLSSWLDQRDRRRLRRVGEDLRLFTCGVARASCGSCSAERWFITIARGSVVPAPTPTPTKRVTIM